IALSASEVGQMAGEYSLRFQGTTDGAPATIRLENRRIYLHFPPAITHDEMVPVTPTRLVSPDWGYSVDLQRNGRGDVVSFTLKYGDKMFIATRSAQPPSSFP